ncbi:MAG: SacI restriction endonuclease [Thermoleophilia bacterium]|nr:SacI restriction endonuclease [Thermoleophilia bacterium]
MGIKIPHEELLLTIERALRDARDPARAENKQWVARLDWLAQQLTLRSAGGKTYVAATGAALLAKATDERVDTLTQKEIAGPRGYTMRTSATLLQKRVRGIAHLGTLSKDPVNNRPFLGGHPRIDHLDNVASYVRHVFDEYVEWMREVDGYGADDAYDALVTFLKVRMRAQAEENLRESQSPRMVGARSLSSLIDTVQLWMARDPEHGARGQAVVAAVLGLGWADVSVIPKNHPAPYDVTRGGERLLMAAEVKQQAISESEVLELARRAAHDNVPACFYAALAPDQPHLAVDRLLIDAVRTHGVFLIIVHDVAELIAKAGGFQGLSADDVAARLPQALIDRCTAAGVSAAGRNDLQQRLDAISAVSRPE